MAHTHTHVFAAYYYYTVQCGKKGRTKINVISSRRSLIFIWASPAGHFILTIARFPWDLHPSKSNKKASYDVHISRERFLNLAILASLFFISKDAASGHYCSKKR